MEKSSRSLLIISVLLLISLCGCATLPQDGVFMLRPESGAYAGALESILPEAEIKPLRDGVFWYLETGTATEAISPQAYSAQKAGLAEYWYPQLLATAIIAIDRDLSSVEISSWGELSGISERVCLYDDLDRGLLLCAMSYGLEGEGFSLKSTAGLLEKINLAGRLTLGGSDAPVIICFDEQAAELIKSGRNLELVVPSEGTLSYQRGLLSPSPLSFRGDVEQTLLDAGLRLTDGRCNAAFYPADYSAASESFDMDHLLTMSTETVRVLRREVLHVRLYSGADGREHQFLALAYIAVISIWTAYVVQRAMQRNIRRGALVACAAMLAWITVRMVKYQTSSLIYWDRFLWFSFQGFQLLLMFTLLLMAWSIDRPEGQPVPRWLWALGGANLLLALLVMTNDLHSLVYVIDYSDPFWRDYYGYAAGYYIITALHLTEFAAANLLLLIKGIRRPGKKALIFPLILCVLITVYRWGYVARIPLMWESDLTLVTGVFVLLFFESAIRSGMIPVNTRYRQFFTHSTLNMQLLDRSGSVALAAASLPPPDERVLNHVLSGSKKPLMLDEDNLLYSDAIDGGYVIWQEDISGLNRLHRETAESVSRLKAANAILAEEEKLKRSLNEEAAKLRLMQRLEDEIAGKTELLTRMIDSLDSEPDKSAATARIALLLCYIKRRCNLFFREHETESLPADELSIYLDEMSELSAHARVRTATLRQLTGSISLRLATLFYDFLYEITAWAAQAECSSMLRSFEREGGLVILRLLPSSDVRGCSLSAELAAAIEAAGGTVTVKDLDDAVGISLAFPEGGGADA